MATHGKITEEGLEELRRKIGVEYPINEPYNEYAGKDQIRHFCRGIGDTNPLYLDEEYAKRTRYGGIIAPPGFLYSFFWGAWDTRRGSGLPGVHGLHSGDDWEWYRPLKLNDRITGKRHLADMVEKFGEFAGRCFIQIRQVNFWNQDGELLGKQRLSSFRVERHEGKSRGKYAGIKKACYTPEELKAIEADYDREEIRGANPRYWEDVKVGDEMTPVVKGPLTEVDGMAWVMGAGSPHIRAFKYLLEYRRRTPAVCVLNPETGVPEIVERVHWDNYLATEIGMPAAYDYGSQRGGWASHLLTNWVSDEGWVKKMDVQYRGMNFMGDTTWVRGKITRKYVENGERLVECEITATNQRGTVIMPGHATMVLPSSV
ncbi:MAG: MaoC family dehydratase N-terminal domain-containing protein [Chloroflexi bacterium]|nr:MaoC family dehydratase N-terminal domain-containing protein [Chloroflexota bacterium]